MNRTHILRQICCTLPLLFLMSCLADEDAPVDQPTGNTALPQGLSALPETPLDPPDNISSPAKVELGRALFWDPILSGARDVSCATCHHPDLGYGDAIATSIGVGGRGLGEARRGGIRVARNSMTILNSAFNGIDTQLRYDPADAPMFWDNRTDALENQALGPIHSFAEMRGDAYSETATIDSVVARLSAIAEYRQLFAAAFGEAGISGGNIARAIAAFERTIVANNSPFDRYARGDETAMTPDQIRGMETFVDAGCATCHSGPMFSDFRRHTLGVPESPFVDTPDDAGGAFDFRTPTLRNLNVTGPFMHNGVFSSLREVMNFYRRGESRNPNVADNETAEEFRRLRLGNEATQEIIAFLGALNDDSFDKRIPARVPSGLPVGGRIN